MLFRSPLNDLNFLGAQRVFGLETYLLAAQAGSRIVQWSDVNSLTFPGTDVATVEARPYPIVSHLIHHREWWLATQEAIEVWVNTGDANTPWRPLQGVFIEVGVLAPASFLLVGGPQTQTPLWLGSDPNGGNSVWMAVGYAAQRISTFAVETAFSTYARLDDAVSWWYGQAGHTFYVLSFPTADATWVYDVTVGQWHERGSWDANALQYHRWRAQYAVQAFGRLLVGHHSAPRLYTLSLDALDEAGAPLRWLRRSPYSVVPSENFLYFNRFQVVMQTGLGLDGGVIPGANPVVMLRWSNDGGGTWTNERQVPCGPIGQRSYRVVVNRCGKARARVWELSGTDPVGPIALVGALVEAEEGLA